ncbi:P-loop NTPase fold protein [Dyella sp. BiH032]|uniref:KAP family P-loop NTPase fold protein n=1 Tax=Dyella sp. BiH032 TaxID=3075430 RepID=UPI0028934FE2|nr:P-loop NTPase fold protein [Dyella sp. BiH032]WNL45660.1 P-loop NTPase fold protein [Dyella sp. BiH032]
MSRAALNHWNGDAFNRKPVADYLTQSLTSQSRKRSGQGKGLTVALDAAWGAGKTFFVKNWSDDLRLLGHPVVYFDAWENDIGDEASVALMAAVVEAMHAWQKANLPRNAKLRKQASGLLAESKKNLRRALVPASKVLLSGVLQKAIGVGFEELSDAMSKSDSPEDPWGRATKAADEILDKLFQENLVSHQSRKDELAAFRKAVHDHLLLVKERSSKESTLPMFIFVDELDRCRPSYAVKLLEEVKHIFGVVDVVYVISTNLHQLQNSVRSLYGAEFDGAGYLRRLFDREYVLPETDGKTFAATLFDGNGPITLASTYSGLPQHGRYDSGYTHSWSMIVSAFGLDLRSQHQLVPLVEEVAAALDDGGHIHALWLFFLCAAFQRNRPFFEVCAGRELDAPDFEDRCRKVFIKNPKIDSSHRGRSSVSRSFSLSEVLSHYYEFSSYDENAARDMLDQTPRNEYPYSILTKVMQPLGQQWDMSRPRPMPIAAYVSLVRSAGFVLRGEEDAD